MWYKRAVPFSELLGERFKTLFSIRCQHEEAGAALRVDHLPPWGVQLHPFMSLIVALRRDPIHGELAYHLQLVRHADTCDTH